MNDIAVRKIEKTILEVMQRRYPLTKFDRDIRADFRAMAEAVATSSTVPSQQSGGGQ
jgi:hypothetical protein